MSSPQLFEVGANSVPNFWNPRFDTGLLHLFEHLAIAASQRDELCVNARIAVTLAHGPRIDTPAPEGVVPVLGCDSVALAGECMQHTRRKFLSPRRH